MMHRRSVFIGLLILALSVPVFASQFVELPFEQVASEAQYIVRGHIVDTWSAWDDAHEVIYTYATVRVNRYFGETAGPDTLVVREVGGTVDGYTQEAIGFPMIRRGENVVSCCAVGGQLRPAHPRLQPGQVPRPQPRRGEVADPRPGQAGRGAPRRARFASTRTKRRAGPDCARRVRRDGRRRPRRPPDRPSANGSKNEERHE